MYALLRVFFATINARKNVRPQKLSQTKKRHRIFARKRYTVTVNGKYRYPPLAFVPTIADFRSMYRKLAENRPCTFGGFE